MGGMSMIGSAAGAGGAVEVADSCGCRPCSRGRYPLWPLTWVFAHVILFLRQVNFRSRLGHSKNQLLFEGLIPEIGLALRLGRIQRRGRPCHHNHAGVAVCLLESLDLARLRPGEIQRLGQPHERGECYHLTARLFVQRGERRLTVSAHFAAGERNDAGQREALRRADAAERPRQDEIAAGLVRMRRIGRRADGGEHGRRAQQPAALLGQLMNALEGIEQQMRLRHDKSRMGKIDVVMAAELTDAQQCGRR